MSSCSSAQSTKVGCSSQQNALPTIANMECHEGDSKPEEEEDEDEDEDVDFNPFLKETLSPEASSSLSSEVEVLDGDAVDSGNVRVSASKHTSEKQNCERESDHGEEVVMQTTVSSEAICEKEIEKIDVRTPKKKSSTLFYEPGSETVRGKDISSGSATVVNDVVEEDLVNMVSSRKPVIDLDTEDAICTRTRARYSLASFSLDELETFLQETDDEDDLQNVDDEEEYRKFLAAVLHGGDGDGCPSQENEIADDDEDNDADFEIELEGLLESDNDENAGVKNEGEHEKGVRRPETRQNRRQKSNAQNKKKLSSHSKRPLRPLLPVLPNVPIPPLSTQIGKMPETAVQDGYVNGFTQQQIGQLHCLIHEHVQLLIQVFCLCVLDSSRQHIASQVQKLIIETLQKRNEVLAWRTISYPSTCFCPAYLCSSVSNDVPKFFPMHCIVESPPRNATDEACSANSEAVASQNVNLSKERSESSNGHGGSFPNMEGLFWAPYVNGPLVTVLDVAPLGLVEQFMDDVKAAVLESRRCHVETGCDTRSEREPLFPLPGFPPVPQVHSEISSSLGQQPLKKTLAATIVESTKKESIALVPRDISKLSQRFFPLFNPALFPHKAPLSAVANRVLFTDSEDELLALGMMEYNTDWKAIQERFLPCKSKHQIFVRQKNRCSSKAPENPIKAVRRMKTSLLTAEEMARIQEGLKIYKYDWLAVWQFSVPHRDPSLLPRQWRIALGTQKSYKVDAEKKEKRRLYELTRRKSKSSTTASWQKMDTQVENSGGNNNSADGCIDNSGKAYVHEAFLADWRPSDPSGHSSLEIARIPHGGLLSQEQLHNQGYGKAPQPTGGYMQQFPSTSNYHHPSFQFSGVKHSGANTFEPNSSVPNMTSSAFKSQFYMRPYRARRSNATNLVRLAPDLPPVNLPPSVRVVSLRGASTSISAAGGVTSDAKKENLISRIPHTGRSGITCVTNSMENKSNSLNDCPASLQAEESIITKEKCVEDERNMESDLQMHPLLFQTPEDGRLPYYPLNCGTSNSSSFSFFSGNQPQLHLSLLHNPHQENLVGSFTKSLELKDSTSLSCGIDFHPLLQRSDYAHGDSIDDQTEFLVNGDPHATGKHIEKANELDLEMHISSASRKESSWGRDETRQNPVKSTTNAPDSGFTTKTNRSLYPYNESSLSHISRPVSGGHSLISPGDNIDRYVDDMGDQSHPEIVMEQEELSDSDEENEESVEFECEEMTDSEGDEESGCEQISEIQIEERPSLDLEKLKTADCEDKTCESRTKIHSEDNVPILGKSIPSLELGLTSQRMDDASNSSWLSLDSSGAHHCPARLMENEHGDTTIRESPATKNLASSRPSRSCKKKNQSMDGVMEQRQPLNGKEQLSLAPLRIPIFRKPRKRARGNSGSLNIELGTNYHGEDKVS